MSKTSPNSKSEFIEEKRKLLYWIARWTDEEAEFENMNLDLPEISVLFQAMGFRLETFEKALDLETVPIIQKSLNMADKNMVRIDLTCPKSGMRSSMIKQTATCRCPSEEEVDKGQFWCVTGCGPSSQNSLNTSNSSLLPRVAPAKNKIIKALLSKVLTLINGTDINENEDIRPVKNTSLLTRHRSLDTLKNNEGSLLNPRGLKRCPSWEVDPKTSPPTQTSSPVPNLCNTMSRISLNSNQSNITVKNLETIKKLVDETLEIASGSNATFVKTNIPKKRVSDIKSSDGLSVNDLIQLTTPPQSVRTTTPRRILTPKKNRVTPGEKKDNMAPPSRIAMLRKKTLIAAGVSSLSGLRRESPRPRTSLAKQTIGNAGSCESIVESRINKVKVGLSPWVGVSSLSGLRRNSPRPRTSLAKQTIGNASSCESIVTSRINKVKADLSPRVSKGMEAGTSGTAKFKDVGKLSSNANTVAKNK